MRKRERRIGESTVREQMRENSNNRNVYARSLFFTRRRAETNILNHLFMHTHTCIRICNDEHYASLGGHVTTILKWTWSVVHEVSLAVPWTSSSRPSKQRFSRQTIGSARIEAVLELLRPAPQSRLLVEPRTSTLPQTSLARRASSA